MVQNELKRDSRPGDDPNPPESSVATKIVALPSKMALFREPMECYNFALRNQAPFIIKFLGSLHETVRTRDTENAVIATYQSRPVTDQNQEIEYNTQLARAIVDASINLGTEIDVEVEDTNGTIWKFIPEPESQSPTSSRRSRLSERVRRIRGKNDVVEPSPAAPPLPFYRLKIETQPDIDLGEFITHTISVVEPLSFS